jgi:hypothetical protein
MRGFDGLMGLKDCERRWMDDPLLEFRGISYKISIANAFLIWSYNKYWHAHYSTSYKIL